MRRETEAVMKRLGAPTLVLATFLAAGGEASAQQAQPRPAGRDGELDVTMRVLTDPEAVQPTEIVRRIPLPLPAAQRPSGAPAEEGEENSSGESHGQETAEQASTPGQEAAEQARERAREATEQRGDIGRSIAEEARRNPGPPDPPLGPPITSPRDP